METGEDLALISFYDNNYKLSIGVQDDISGLEYEYLENGIRITVSNLATINKIIFYVAWLTMHNIETEDIYTWFAADPTLCADDEKP